MERYQYFDFFEYCDDEIESFVDGGGCDGTSSYHFSAWCRGNYSNIFIFEPDVVCYKQLCDGFMLKNTKLFNYGLYDENKEIAFQATHDGQSEVCETGDEAIKVVRLDDILREEKVSFIKMDIEGSEYNALLGAKEIIKAQKPKLAICTYHKPEHLIEIPKLILSMNPEYKLAFRVYSWGQAETVLYAK